MSEATIVGLLAAIFTTLAYAPQAVKAWRSKSTGDLSFGMFFLMVIGMACWLIYGSLIGDLPLIVANIITLALAASILVAKVRYG